MAIHKFLISDRTIFLQTRKMFFHIVAPTDNRAGGKGSDRSDSRNKLVMKKCCLRDSRRGTRCSSPDRTKIFGALFFCLL